MLNSIYTVMVNNRKIIVVINGGSNSRRSRLAHMQVVDVLW